MLVYLQQSPYKKSLIQQQWYSLSYLLKTVLEFKLIKCIEAIDDVFNL